MAGARSCLGIDIGAHSIRVADISYSSQGVEIKALAEARLQVEAGEKESQRQTAIVNQLTALLKANKIKTKQAVFCVPGQTVFVRPGVRVPATTPERLERIIRFEAREKIPFPLEKTILEYQVFESDTPTEVEVLMVAIKREYIENFMKLVRKTGLKPLSISVSSLALHNFYEANGAGRKLLDEAAKGKSGKGAKKNTAKKGLSLKFGKKKGAAADAEAAAAIANAEENEPYDSMETEEVRAEVNVGATIMDLAIPRAGQHRRIGFTRSVPVAGSQVDRAIRTKLNLDTNEEAMRIKEQETAILASDFEIAGDTGSVNMPASEAATAVVDRMLAEIRRSLDYFIAQPDGVAVDGLVLSGGMARMNYLSNYLEEKMGLPVELASVRNEGIKIAEELAESVPSFVIPIGLGLQGVGVGQIKIDFLPQDIKNLRAFKDKRAQLISAVVLLLATLGVSLVTGEKYKAQNVDLAAQYETQIKNTANQFQLIEKANLRSDDLFKKYDTLTKVKGFPLSNTLYMATTVLILKTRPPDVLLTNMDIMSEGSIVLTGLSPSRQSIIEFTTNLNTMPSANGYLKNAEVANMDLVGRADPRFKTNVFPFMIKMQSLMKKGRFRSIKNSTGSAVDATGQVRAGGSRGGFMDALKGMNFGGKK